MFNVISSNCNYNDNGSGNVLDNGVNIMGKVVVDQQVQTDGDHDDYNDNGDNNNKLIVK